MLRNHQQFGRWTPVRSSAGASLLEAWGPWADGGPGMEKIDWPPVPPTADEFVRAGADTRYISRRYGMSSPVLTQWPKGILSPAEKSDFTVCHGVDYHERAWDECKHGRASSEP